MQGSCKSNSSLFSIFLMISGLSDTSLYLRLWYNLWFWKMLFIVLIFQGSGISEYLIKPIATHNKICISKALSARCSQGEAAFSTSASKSTRHCCYSSLSPTVWSTLYPHSEMSIQTRTVLKRLRNQSKQSLSLVASTLQTESQEKC